MTDVGTCRHGIHRPQRPCLLLVRARSPISSAPPDSVSGLTAARLGLAVHHPACTAVNVSNVARH